jgi:uncharacterized membrane protein
MERRYIMSTNRARIAWVLTICASMASGCAAQVARAKQEAAARRGATEPCFGVARAGKNDCRTHAHVCAGWARQERDPGAFIYVPAGTCSKIVGGRLEES